MIKKLPNWLVSSQQSKTSIQLVAQTQQKKKFILEYIKLYICEN